MLKKNIENHINEMEVIKNALKRLGYEVQVEEFENKVDKTLSIKIKQDDNKYYYDDLGFIFNEDGLIVDID